MMAATRGMPLVLRGSARQRGLAQARLAGDQADRVRDWVRKRLASAGKLLAESRSRAYLAAQRRFAMENGADELVELEDVAEGFGISAYDLFAHLHLGFLREKYEVDGCTSWAQRIPSGGAFLAKNRDLAVEGRGLQAVFLHCDDPLRPERRILTVGSLGSPGVYSSGINEAGLAVADTAIPTPDHAVGWFRYALMTRLLWACDDVVAALAFIRAAPHAGGGSLVLADAAGVTAAVELHADGPVVETGSRSCRTNHFLRGPDGAPPPGAIHRSSRGRLAAIRAALEDGLAARGAPAIAQVMASHGSPGTEGLCRHGDDGEAATISTAIYQTTDCSLLFARGRPCSAKWESFSIDDGQEAPPVDSTRHPHQAGT